MEVRSHIQTGEYHKQTGARCQDCCYHAENQKYLAVSLADGVSACRYGGEGAKALCEAIADEAVHAGDYLMKLPAARIGRIMEGIMETILEAISQEDGSILEYSSTFLMVLLNKTTAEMVMINLGDGAVLRVRNAEKEELLPPVRYHGQPCTSAVKDLSESIQVEYRMLKEDESILLCTDGFLAWLEAAGDETVRRILQSSQWYNVLDQEVGKAAVMDDCSYIMLQQ